MGVYKASAACNNEQESIVLLVDDISGLENGC